MTLDHNSGTEISLEEAEVCAHAFQEGNPDAIKSFYVGENKLKRVLQQEGCMGIRIYNGYDTNQNNKANL